MEVFLNAEFLRDFGNSVERGYGVVLPAFARGKDIGAQNSTPHPSPPHEPEHPLTPSLSPAQSGGEGVRRTGEGVALREFPQRYQAQRLGVLFYARHVLGADVDGFVENRDGFEFGHGLKRRAQIRFVTFGIRRREGHIDVQTGSLRGVERGPPLRWRGRLRLILSVQMVAP